MFGRAPRAAAGIAAALGRREDAVRLLGRSVQEGHARRWSWHTEPDFASLLDYPPFLELLKPRG
jgi:hypothetical protein